VAAGATQSIRLMSTITLLPLYPAALLAKMGAALDVASGGRFILGVGVGGEFKNEFDACGVPVKQRGTRTDDALEVLERTWTETDVSYSGRYTHLEKFSIKPLPIQKPRPPIWISGRQEAAWRRTARYGDGWLPYMYTPEQLSESVAAIRGYAGDCGRDPESIRIGMYIFTAVHDDDELGIKMASEKLSVQYSQDFSKLVHKYALAGNPDRCIKRLTEYVDAGADFLFLSTACPEDYISTNLSLISKEIIPAFG
jgi:alkanesulfonate monooxygenase SsuD/methylene tetrahydromethanopterin reductase-like flavin-dependent oxidoreductase (luciferase family)